MPSFHGTSSLNFFQFWDLCQDIWTLKIKFFIDYVLVWFISTTEKILRRLAVYLQGNPVVDGEKRQSTQTTDGMPLRKMSLGVARTIFPGNSENQFRIVSQKITQQRQRSPHQSFVGRW